MAAASEAVGADSEAVDVVALEAVSEVASIKAGLQEVVSGADGEDSKAVAAVDLEGEPVHTVVCLFHIVYPY